MFTVLIPLYNKAAYIQRALDSVYAQIYPPGEILIVNDGSTDGSAEIVRRQANPLICVLNQSNQGVSVARNNGLSAATQPYVAFLDADDQWDPGFLAAMRRAILLFPNAILYGSGFATVAGGKVLRQHAIDPGAEGATTPREVFFFSECSAGHPLSMSTTVVARDAAIQVGGFPEKVEFCEDHIFWAKLALLGSVVLSPEVLADYDVAVPGQAVDVWKMAYKDQVLEYHRFLACEMRSRLNATTLERSFQAYSRHVLRTALFQRFYWGNFQAIQDLWREAELASLRLGGLANACAWVAENPYIQPLVAVPLTLLRSLRQIVQARTPCKSMRKRCCFPDAEVSATDESVVRNKADRHRERKRSTQ